MDFQEKPKKGHIPGGRADVFLPVYLAVRNEFSPVRIWVAEGTRTIYGLVAPRNPVLGHLEMCQAPTWLPAHGVPGTEGNSQPQLKNPALEEQGALQGHGQGIHETAAIS